MIHQRSARHPVTEVIVHCAATRPDWMAGRPTAEKVAEIRRQRLTKGWRDIGYHGISDRDGTAEPIATGLAAILSLLTGAMAEGIHGFMLAVAPIVAHRRGGRARLYTASPAKERERVGTIEDGRSAFEAGRAFGKRLRKTSGVPPPRAADQDPSAVEGVTSDWDGCSAACGAGGADASAACIHGLNWFAMVVHENHHGPVDLSSDPLPVRPREAQRPVPPAASG